MKKSVIELIDQIGAVDDGLIDIAYQDGLPVSWTIKPIRPP